MGAMVGRWWRWEGGWIGSIITMLAEEGFLKYSREGGFFLVVCCNLCVLIGR